MLAARACVPGWQWRNTCVSADTWDKALASAVSHAPSANPASLGDVNLLNLAPMGWVCKTTEFKNSFCKITLQ